MDGTVATRAGSGEWSRFQKNLVVSGGSAALAAGIAATDGKTNALYHALGVGRYQWDFSLPNPEPSATSLVDEYFRRTPNSVTYIDEYIGLHETSSPNPDDELQSTIFGTIGGDLLIGRLIEIIAGTGAGDVREITSYTSPDIVTLSSGLSATPDETTRFRVGVVSSTPTGVVDVVTVFPATEGNSDGQIREHGLFCGAATAELGTGTLLCIQRHSVIAKTGEDLTRVWRLRIELVT